MIALLSAEDEAQIRSIFRQELQGILKAAPVQPDLMTPKQAAAHCQVTEATLRNWRAKGLKVETRGRVVRYRRRDLDAFMAGTRANPDEAAAALFG